MPIPRRGETEGFGRNLARLPRPAGATALLDVPRTWVGPETVETSVGYVQVQELVVRLHRDRLGAIVRTLVRAGIRIGLQVLGVEWTRVGLGLPLIARLSETDQTLSSLGNKDPDLGNWLGGWHLYAVGELGEGGLLWRTRRVVGLRMFDSSAGIQTNRASRIDGDSGQPSDGAVEKSKPRDRHQGVIMTHLRFR